jgi:hypothetical protein
MKKLLLVLIAGITLIPISSFAEQPPVTIKILEQQKNGMTVVASSAAHASQQTKMIDDELESNPLEKATAVLLVNMRTDGDFLNELAKLKDSILNCGAADGNLLTANTSGMLEMDISKTDSSSPASYIHFPQVLSNGRIDDGGAMLLNNDWPAPLTKSAILDSMKKWGEKNKSTCSTLRLANSMNTDQLNKNIGSLSTGPAIGPGSVSKSQASPLTE